MFEVYRGGERAVVAGNGDGNGYVETDPSGRYGRFDDVLGRGAMKTVYRAFDELNGIEVAWNQAKICDVMRSPEALQRMYSEVHLLSSLRHESIIRFHASWIDIEHRTFNFITEMFTSGTLRQYRQRYRQVDIKAIKSWARQILNGLVYVHSHDPPVIHRDLKCDNIFVNGHLGEVKIGDLGLAAVLRGSQCAHSVIGTPEFMAPELYEEEYNELVDIYSFGMCMLEMLTAEYPYSECSNTAQIYKKVTSGKLPDAFSHIQDPETKRFISRCLENVSRRSSAQELLLDPFLASDDHGNNLAVPRTTSSVHKEKEKRSNLLEVSVPSPTQQNRDMTITGKMNAEDDAIILGVQIIDKNGKPQNIYFPFDVINDTPIDVANEMVRELEITDRDSSEIAEMIAHEISHLLPDWNLGGDGSNYNVLNYEEDDGDGNKHPFYYLSSPTSSQSSVIGIPHSQSEVVLDKHHYCPYQDDWFRDTHLADDDEMSSMHSGAYSVMNYISCHDESTHYDSREVPRTTATATTSSHKSTTQLPDPSLLYNKFNKQCNLQQPEFLHSSSHRSGKESTDNRRLMRNRSMVDVRSQLLHRTLVAELNKRLFNTVGAVENIGFQVPFGGSGGSSSSNRKSSSMNSPKHNKNAKY